MALTLAQRAILEKARTLGGGGQAIALTDGACRFLFAVIARDLGFQAHFPEFPDQIPRFFSSYPLSSLELSNGDVRTLFERLIALDANADTYFRCLSTLHKARLKYERILEVQPLPTIDQVGPRGLLQFGTMPDAALSALLLWRKWMFDIDNRAAQETGYLFEPIIAASLGGVPASSRNSPVKRRRDPTKGRQVDCVLDHKAYEFKIRVTIAASGQGRWGEELEFPEDCKASGFVPVLIVLDPTSNHRLRELAAAFEQSGGEIYIGAQAWQHLEGTAGPTLGQFLKAYVHTPIQALLDELPDTDIMPRFTLTLADGGLGIDVDGQVTYVTRFKPAIGEVADLIDQMPDDADE